MNVSLLHRSISYIQRRNVPRLNPDSPWWWSCLFWGPLPFRRAVHPIRSEPQQLWKLSLQIQQFRDQCLQHHTPCVNRNQPHCHSTKSPHHPVKENSVTFISEMHFPSTQMRKNSTKQTYRHQGTELLWSVLLQCCNPGVRTLLTQMPHATLQAPARFLSSAENISPISSLGQPD